MLDNAVNQPSKFRTKNWVEKNDESRGTYSVNRQINFKTPVVTSSLCNYNDACILVNGKTKVDNTTTAAAPTNKNKKLILKNGAPFTNWISKINNTQADNAEYIDIVMPMYNLIEYSDDFFKTSGSLWQYCKDIQAVNDDGNIVDFNGANATDSFNFKIKMTDQTDDDGEIANIEITIPLKYLSNFWITLEMPLFNYEVNLILTLSENCVIVYTNITNQGAMLEI